MGSRWDALTVNASANPVADVPLVVLALVFVVLASLEWRRLVVSSRIGLGVAAVFAIAASRYPGESAADIVDHTNDGVAYLVMVARGAGLAVVLVSVSVFIRSRATGD